MNRILLVLAVLGNGGWVLAQPGQNGPTPFNSAQRGGAVNPFNRSTSPRVSLAVAEENVLLRHYEKLLEMKLEMEMQWELEQIDLGPNHPQLAKLKSRLDLITKRIQSTR